MHGSKAKQKIYSLTFHQQAMSSYFLGIRALAHVAVAPEEKHHNNKWTLSPLLLSLSFYI